MSLLKSKIFIISMAVLVAIAIITPTTIVLLRDQTPPTIQILNPKSGYSYSGTILIEITAEDDSKVMKIEISIDDILQNESSTYNWDTTGYLDGFHNITAVATDKSGNTAIASIICTVDNFINPPPTEEFKILNYNVKESGIGEEWIEVVKAENPDIAIFVETGTWDDGGNRKLNNVINLFNGYFYEEAPYIGYTTQGVTYSTTGEAILSRYPILEFNQIDPVTLDDASEHYLAHDFIHAIVDIQGKEVHIIGYHLKCCEGDFNEQRREKEQEGIINYMDDLGDVPIMYVGDLNSLSPADINDTTRGTFTDFGYGPATMLLDPSDEIYGNYSSKVHNFTDVYRTLLPSNPGHTLNILNYESRIDFIFVNQYFNNTLISSNIGIGTELDDTASDHYTLDAVISITNISILPKLEKTKQTYHSFTETTRVLEDLEIKNVELITLDIFFYWTKRNIGF
ncbi:MAG: endonuclease/exonuclease/phosphatase family protein [Candidatus Heimdallarchaeota archaeon]|nr:endonuclease/exonuclease/phosphatase family protein [Candidatus Heimdallarchaeota archaeon]